jgi:hypothetical protein
MKASFPNIMEKQRLIVLSRSILWGHKHFDSNLGLGFASNGLAYTVPNLRYGAALLEAVHDQREIELSASEAVNRANTVIATVLRSRNGGFLRWVGSSALELPTRLLANHVLPVLVFLDRHDDAMRLTHETKEAVRESLFKILRKLSEGSGDSESTPSKQNTGIRVSEPVADIRLLNELTSKLPKDYHWSRSVGMSHMQIIQHGPCPLWQFPRPTCGLVEGQDLCCVVNGYIETWFYKGDWKDPKPPTIPVVFVGGWQPFVQGSASPGFLCQSWWSIRPPQNAPHPEGHHPPMAPPTPPPIFEFWIETEQNKAFDGLGLGLMKAGYDCVRFAQSAPDDDIMIAVDELKHVVDKTKHLYQTNKVVLVCHSRGGLVARKYIVNRWNAERIIDVAKLITYGTPHLGAQLGEIGAEIITGLPLMAVFGPEIMGLFDSIRFVPGVGPSIESEIQSRLIQLFSQFSSFDAEHGGNKIHPQKINA